MRPFTILEDNGLKKFINNLSNNRFQLPSRKLVTELVPELYLLIEQQVWRYYYYYCYYYNYYYYNIKVQQVIKTEAEDVWLAADGWTSHAGQSYFTILAHFLTQDFKPVTFALATLATNDHTSENLSSEMIDVLEQWKLTSKVRGLVADNTASMPKTAKLMQQEESLSTFEFWGCVGHLINLVVKHSLEDRTIANIISKCHNIVTYIHKSPQALETLQNFQKEAGVDVLGVIQSVPTRWNSTFLMLNRLLKIKIHLLSTLRKHERHDLVLSKTEWEIVNNIVVALEPFYDATEHLSGERYQPYSSVVPIIANLQEKCTNAKGQITSINKLYENLREKISYYFFGKDFLDIFSTESLLCCLLDPRFKLLSFIAINDTHVEKAKQKLAELHDAIYEEISAEKTNNNKVQQKFEKIYGSLSTSKSTCRQICNRYFSEPQPAVEKLPYEWWQFQQTTYPAHAKLARRYLSRMPTSVSCERFWSEGGNIVSEKRSALDPDSVSMLTVAEHNLRELERIGKQFKWKTAMSLCL